MSKSHEDAHDVFPDIPAACAECGSLWVIPCEEVWKYECLNCDDGPRHVQPDDPHYDQQAANAGESHQ